ncbi:MAG: ABC transporter ATP-binding protein [Desulfovibrio sp.]|nr:ABC transporter ATP-binding protein [Desulfovibrio sp.]
MLFTGFFINHKESKELSVLKQNELVKIRVNNLTKKFGDLTVLNNINFTIKKGELLAIVGPTGCGKTTFLNCLSKLMPTTEGEILIDGEAADPRKHNISYVFQEPTCLPWRTVRENVAYGMEIKGVPRAERMKRADEIMALVGLSSCANLYPNQVSASMMQRIAVSRAFAVRPDLLLMDEPYGQLDVKLRYYLEDELVNLWRTVGSTVLFVTHNIEEAVYVAERVLVLTNKPTSVKQEVVIDLPRPRDLVDPKFVELRRQVTDLIRWW